MSKLRIDDEQSIARVGAFRRADHQQWLLVGVGSRRRSRAKLLICHAMVGALLDATVVSTFYRSCSPIILTAHKQSIGTEREIVS
jgi:hypothetical protein